MRQLTRAPGLTVVAILSLAISIGAATAIYSVIHAVLLDPYPYRGAARMVQFELHSPSGDGWFGLLPRQFLELQQLDALDGAVSINTWFATSTGDDLPEAISLAHVSANTFDYLGIPPVLGREFTSADAPYGREPEHVAVLGFSFWQKRYGGDPHAIGKSIRLDGQQYIIIGVVPPRFRWGFGGEVYVPTRIADGGEAMYVEARLKQGVAPQRAEAEVQSLLEHFAKENPKQFPGNSRVHIAYKNDVSARGSRSTLVLLLLASFALLAVACANVSILQLARGTARAQELAVRAAIGATRRRLAVQLFTESLLLAVVGGLMGIALAWYMPGLVERWVPARTFPQEANIHVNMPVLLFSTGIALLTGILFGIAPALQLSMPRLAEWIQAGNRRATLSRGSRRAHGTLIALQVALTLLLLAGAGAAARELIALHQARLGYDPSHLLVVRVPLAEGSYTTLAARTAFYETIRKSIASHPQVKSVALFHGDGPPPNGGWREPLEIFGSAANAGDNAQVLRITPGYFATLRIPLLRGRDWSETEHAHAARVAVINQAMEKRYWPRGNAIGQKIRFPDLRVAAYEVGLPDANDWLEIIGVAGDTPNRGLKEPPSPAAYIPNILLEDDSAVLVVRTRIEPLAMMLPIRQLLRSISPSQVITGSDTAENILRKVGWAREQLVSSLFALFAGIALALAAIGIYGVVSYATALRLHEFGIRMALGATRRNIIRAVLIPAAQTFGLGVITGLILTFLSHALLSHWTTAKVSDPRVLVPVILVLLVATALAVVIPAHRAAHADPAAMLRE